MNDARSRVKPSSWNSVRTAAILLAIEAVGCSDHSCTTQSNETFDIVVYASASKTDRICDANVRTTDSAGRTFQLTPSGADPQTCNYDRAPQDAPGHWVAHVEHAGFAAKDYAFDVTMGECYVVFREVRIDLTP